MKLPELLKIWTATGAIECYRRKTDWDQIGLYLAIAGMSCFVGFILAILLFAHMEWLKPLI